MDNNDISNTKEKNKTIAKNTVYLYIRLALVLVVSLYISRVVLNALGVVDYGIYNVVAGFVSMFALLSSALTNSIQRFYNYEKGKEGLDGFKKVYITSIFIQVIIALLILLLVESIGLWYIENKMVYPPERHDAVLIVFHASICSLLITVLQIPFSSAIIALENIQYHALVGVLDVLFKLAIALFMASSDTDRLSLYAILMTGVSVLNFLLYYGYVKRKFSFLKFKFIFYKKLFVDMLKFTGWYSFNGLSQIVKHQGVNVLVNLFFGPIVNAAHGVAYQVKSALLGFVMNITTASQPQMVESYALGDTQRSIKLMNTISKFMFFSLFIVALPIMLEIDCVLRLWLGETVPEYANIFVIIVLITTLIDILCGPQSILINAKGDIALYNIVTSILGLLVIPISFVFLKQGCEPQVVYLIGLCLSLVILFVSSIITKQKIGFTDSLYLKEVILPIILVAIISTILPTFLSVIMNEGYLRFLIVIIVSVISVGLCSYFIGLSSGERLFIQTLVRKHILKKTS